MIGAPEAEAVDTSVLVAAHVRTHEHRALAAPVAAGATHVIAPVIAETWSVLRRHIRLPASEVEIALRGYVGARTLVIPDATVYDELLLRGASIGLAGNVHDFVIVETARRAGLSLATFDKGMRHLATSTVVPLA